jgi:hypothetical protein
MVGQASEMRADGEDGKGGGGEERDEAPSIVEAGTSIAGGDNRGRLTRDWSASLQARRTSLGVPERNVSSGGRGWAREGAGGGGDGTMRSGNGGGPGRGSR